MFEQYQRSIIHVIEVQKKSGRILGLKKIFKAIIVGNFLNSVKDMHLQIEDWEISTWIKSKMIISKYIIISSQSKIKKNLEK